MPSDLSEIPEDGVHELRVFLSGVLRELAPDELDGFVRSGETAIRRQLSPNPLPSFRSRGVAGMMEVGVVAIHLIAGTLGLVEMYRTRKDRKEQLEFERNIVQEWQKALIEAGMSPDLARQIPVKFSGDVIRFVAGQRLRVSREGGEAISDTTTK